MDNKVYPYILTIIDMQYSFLEVLEIEKSLIEKVKNLIKTAKDNKAFIIFAVYKSHGKVHKDLLDLVADYKHYCCVDAFKPDKSKNIIKEIPLNCSKNMKICGVYLDVCIRRSVFGLSKKLQNWSLEVIKKSCGDFYLDPYDKKDCFEIMNQLSNVSII